MAERMTLSDAAVLFAWKDGLLSPDECLEHFRGDSLRMMRARQRLAQLAAEARRKAARR